MGEEALGLQQNEKKKLKLHNAKVTYTTTETAILLMK